MKPEQLDEIIEAAPDKLREVMGELHEHILEAAYEALAQSQDSESGGKPKVSVGLKLVISLNTALPSWQVKGSVGVNYSYSSAETMLEDPRQGKLPLDNFVDSLNPGDSMSILSGGKGVKLSKNKAGKVSAEKVGGDVA
jgi:hypothetical protein